jgi:Family of unknown function (DUF6492)
MNLNYDVTMSSFILFCKSFKDDVLRAKRLIESISRWNTDQIPFYLSVPESDISLFSSTIDFEAMNALQQGSFHLITDESIVACMPNTQLSDYKNMRGYLSQQVVKAEAWRLLGCESYLCLDSDAFFIRPFSLKDFLHADGNPYSLMHDAKELLDLAKAYNKKEVLDNFLNDSKKLKDEFNRIGPDFDFGPAPLIWSAKVWESLYTQYLSPKGERLWEAIARLPMEIRWYGEALLKFHAINIHAIQPIFTCYHYQWQYQHAQQFNQTIGSDTKALGVVMQSYWDEDLRPKFAQKSLPSRLWKKIKNRLRSQKNF